MAFIDTVPPDTASGDVHELYESTRKHYGGVVPNWAQACSTRPEVLRTWGRLISTVRSNLDERRYELATVAAAKAMKNSYCSLAHGQRLLGTHLSSDEMSAFFKGDYQAAGLSPAEVALVEYAEAVATRAHSVTQADIDTLRGHGFSDTEIFDIASAAAARCFFSKLMDGLGVQPDATFREEIDEPLREALTVGRPIDLPSDLPSDEPT